MSDTLNDVKRQEITGNSSLHEAIAVQNLGAVINLLAAGADVHARNSAGETPLHFVHDYKIAQLLIAAGADVHACNNFNDTPLAANIVARCVPVVKLLLQSGADVNFKAGGSYYATPLHLAVSQFFECFAIVELLVAYGADVNAQDATGKTPLHIMMQHRYTTHNNRRIIKLLLDAGADFSIKDQQGSGPLDYAQNLDPQLLNQIKKILR
jgi:ankyrin repeat protein